MLGGTANDALESHPSGRGKIDPGVQKIAVAGVGDDQAVLGVVTGEPLGDGLDGIHQPALATQTGLLGPLLLGDVGHDGYRAAPRRSTSENSIGAAIRRAINEALA